MWRQEEEAGGGGRRREEQPAAAGPKKRNKAQNILKSGSLIYVCVARDPSRTPSQKDTNSWSCFLVFCSYLTYIRNSSTVLGSPLSNSPPFELTKSFEVRTNFHFLGLLSPLACTPEKNIPVSSSVSEENLPPQQKKTTRVSWLQQAQTDRDRQAAAAAAAAAGGGGGGGETQRLTRA